MEDKILLDVAKSRSGRASPNLIDLLDVLKGLGTAEQWRAMFQLQPSREYVVYCEYLKSAAWKKKRDAALEAAGGKCQRCGCGFEHTGKSLGYEVHHKTYARLGDELPADLEALCDQCHGKIHGKERS